MTTMEVVALRRDPTRERILVGTLEGKPVELNVGLDVQNHQRLWLRSVADGAPIPDIDDEPTKVQVFTSVRDNTEYVSLAEAAFVLENERGERVHELPIADLSKEYFPR